MFVWWVVRFSGERRILERYTDEFSALIRLINLDEPAYIWTPGEEHIDVMAALRKLEGYILTSFPGDAPVTEAKVAPPLSTEEREFWLKSMPKSA